PSRPEQFLAVMSLGRLGPAAASAVPKLVELALAWNAHCSALDHKDESPYFQGVWGVIEALGRIGPAAKDAVPAISKIATGPAGCGWPDEDPIPEVVRALDRIQRRAKTPLEVQIDDSLEEQGCWWSENATRRPGRVSVEGLEPDGSWRIGIHKVYGDDVMI